MHGGDPKGGGEVMAVRKKRGPKHRGVVLIKPDLERRIGWRARYRDPDTGRLLKVSLDPSLTTDEGRLAWAVRKSKELVVRRVQLDGGATAVTRNALTDAVDGYYKAVEAELRSTTLALYRAATGLFLQWARARNIGHTTDLKATRLPDLRDFLLAQRKRSYRRVGPGRKSGRGEGTSKLSPQTINWQLRAIKKLLNHLRVRGLVLLSSDQIRDALKPVPALREAPAFLRPVDIAKLLEAALRHDADVYAMTRDEAAGVRPKGTTLKYAPVTPYLATVLLTGMRAGEASALRWGAVDLDAPNAEGGAVGEIRLKASETKTKIARTIGLSPSPSLHALLAALKERAKHGESYVFGGRTPFPKTLAEAARRRLVVEYKAPEFSWQLLRSTAATISCNAPGIFGDAAAFTSSKRLGHSVAVAEKHYADQFAVSRHARTLEQAMGIEEIMARVVSGVAPASAPVKLVLVGK